MPRNRSAEHQKLVKMVIDDLRRRLEEEEWRPSDLLPSETRMMEFYGVSRPTVRNARNVLKGEGLIEISQGKRARVRHRAPTYKIDINPGTHARTGLAEPPSSIPTASHVRREWSTQDKVTVPGLIADRLGLEPDAVMAERVMTLTADDNTLLTSTTYLPVGLSNADGVSAWQTVDVGQLALTDHVVAVEFLDVCSRMPNPAESDELGMADGVPLTIVSSPCQVRAGDRTLPAGVVVRAPGDRVLLRIGLGQSYRHPEHVA
jgi:GntR family transcriptional regulator